MRLTVGCLLVCFLATTGCNPLDRFDRKLKDLESRVEKLEKDKEAKEQENTTKRLQLERCVTVEADQVYRDYMELNAKTVKRAGKDVWQAPQYVWEEARRAKLDKIEECKLLYGQ